MNCRIYDQEDHQLELERAFDELEAALPVGTRVAVFGRPGLVRAAAEEIQRLRSNHSTRDGDSTSGPSRLKAPTSA
jgi:hypothetical protein